MVQHYVLAISVVPLFREDLTLPPSMWRRAFSEALERRAAKQPPVHVHLREPVVSQEQYEKRCVSVDA